MGDKVRAVLEETIGYRENGQRKTATRAELRLKMLRERAVKGDVRAAATLLDERKHAFRHGETGGLQIIVEDWLPDFAGQTAQQKTASSDTA